MEFNFIKTTSIFKSKSIKIKEIVNDTGGGIWDSMVFEEGHKIALACDDGTIRIYNIDDEGITFYKLLPKQQGILLIQILSKFS